MNRPGGSPLLISPKEALDSPQFEQLQGVIGISAGIYDHLALPEERLEPEMATFYETGQNPDLSARHLDMEMLDDQSKALQDFKDGLLEDLAVHPLVKQVYRWKVNELLANVRMAQASALGDMHGFSQYNHFVYGAPDADVAAAVVDWFRRDALKAYVGEDRPAAEAGEDVLEVLPDLQGNRDLLVPDEITFARARQDHYRQNGYYALLLAGVDLEGESKITPEVGEPAIEQILHNIDADHYTRELRATKAWAVKNSQAVVAGPAEYSMPVKRFTGLVAGHEIGSHILEYINGLRSGLKLNAIGLDRYELGNEGRAVIREQVPYETFEEFSRLLRWQDILRRHFSIAYGLGVTGEPQAFREVFAAVNAVDRLWERKKLKADEPVEKADEAARKRTESLLTRSLKGTDGEGGAYRKDIVYLEGNVLHWQLAGNDPKIISQGDKGKFNLTNSRHQDIERKLGVLR